jgi:GntR family transcriptional regulator, transcriptional repressor for pyruvate dehydrogenase complex
MDSAHPVATLGDQLYERISKLIIDGTFGDGAKLPTEAELCERFGASRPVVREALARLRANHVITSRRGSGSYVQRLPAAPRMRFAPLGSIAELDRWYEFRALIESEAAYFAAKRRDAAALARIRAALRAYERAIAGGRSSDDADFAFHMAVAEASMNAFFVETVSSVRNQMMFSISLARSLTWLKPETSRRTVQAEHGAVFEAIRDRNPEQARRAMRRHINNVRRRVFEGQAATD